MSVVGFHDVSRMHAIAAPTILQVQAFAQVVVVDGRLRHDRASIWVRAPRRNQFGRLREPILVGSLVKNGILGSICDAGVVVECVTTVDTDAVTGSRHEGFTALSVSDHRTISW